MDNERKDSIIKKAMQHMGKPIDEITRRNTYRARSPGVKPTTGNQVDPAQDLINGREDPKGA